MTKDIEHLPLFGLSWKCFLMWIIPCIFYASRLGNNSNLFGNGTNYGSGPKKMDGALLSAIIIPIVAAIALFVIFIVLLLRTLKEKGNTTWRKSFFWCHALLYFLPFNTLFHMMQLGEGLLILKMKQHYLRTENSLTENWSILQITLT